MATILVSPQKLYLPHQRCWTVTELEQAEGAGVFHPEERLELIEGRLINQEMPMKSAHATGVSLSEDELRNAFPTGFYVRGQLPLVLDESNAPHPDIAVVVGSIRDYRNAPPTTAVLVVEISDTTLRMDRTTKAELYARAGILDYWILNLVDRQLEVHRKPVPMQGRSLDHYYADVKTYLVHESVAPLAAPHAVVVVAHLLP